MTPGAHIFYDCIINGIIYKYFFLSNLLSSESPSLLKKIMTGAMRYIFLLILKINNLKKYLILIIVYVFVSPNIYFQKQF